MKKIISLAVAVLFCTAVYAQTDSIATSNTKADTAPSQSEASRHIVSVGERPLADSIPFEEARTLSRRQQMKYFGHDFSSWFLEVKYLYGTRDLAIGLNLSYVPNTLGVYGTFMNGINAYWGSAGVVYRFSRIESRFDFQAYAGLVAGYGYGAEVGMRLARVNRHHKTFSWMSVSLGVALTNYGSFVSCGLSLPFGVPTAAICLF